jgi:hypothetical protein
MLGFLGVLGRACHQHHSLARRIQSGLPVTKPSTLALVKRCQEELGMSGTIRLYELGSWHSPAVFGLHHPSLLLPEGLIERLDDRELRLIVLHELLHIRRGDLLLHGLLVGIQAVHWFNPLVWLAFRRLRAERELVCDAAVLRRLNPGDQLAYGQTLIKLAQEYSRGDFGPLLVPILNRKTELKRRITLISEFRPGRWPAAAAGSVAWVLLAGVTLTTAARDEADSTQLKPVPFDPQSTSNAKPTPEPSPVPAPPTLRRLEAEEAALRDQVLQGQRQLDILRSELGILPTEAMLQAGNNSIGQLERARASARQELEWLKAMQRNLGSLNKTDLRSSTADLYRDDLWTALFQSRAQAEQQLDLYGPDHPETKAARRVLTTIDAQLDERVEGVLLGIKAKTAASQAGVEALDRLLDANKGGTSKMDVHHRAYIDAQRQQNLLESSLDAVQNRLFQEKLDATFREP